MSPVVTAYVTAPSEFAAELAEALVDERLAACVNRFECRSTYRWDGEVVHDDEVVLLIKTTADRYADLESRVEALHPYDVPCIERFDARDAFDPFADWVEDSVE
jgi:periplasmic divalent cation tolerance protein